MTVKPALAGAAIAMLASMLPTGTVSSATQTLTGVAGWFDDPDGEQTDTLHQGFAALLVQGDATAYSGPGDPIAGPVGDPQEAAPQFGALRGHVVDAAPAGEASANELAFGGETVPSVSAATRSADAATAMQESAGAAAAAGTAPSTLARMLGRLIEYGANATGGAPER